MRDANDGRGPAVRPPDEVTLRDQVVECCRRMHERGYISGWEGNVSARVGPGRILVTPSRTNKGYLKPGDLLLVDDDGKPLRSKVRPTSELKVHLAVYRARPDCGGVVHAHPPTAIAFTIAGISVAQCLVPEAVMTLGEVPTAEYATPTTQDVARGVERLALEHDVIMMDRHGSVTLGRDVLEAYDRLESLEHTAQVTLYARMLGPVRALPEGEIARLRVLGEALGTRRAFSSCEGCNVCGGRGDAHRGEDPLVAEVLARVMSRLPRA
jgi:L-fuculose-phosphate aldolase